MAPLYLTDEVGGLLFWALFVIWAGSEMVTYLRLRFASNGRKRDRGSRAILVIGYWLAILLAFVAAVAVPSATINWRRSLVFYVGAGLLLGGLLLRQYAIVTLGRFHTLDVSTRPGQPLIETGPYRWIRHPSYAGAMLTAAGILLCSTNWLSLACYLLVMGGYSYRIRVEERALAQDVGEAYREYMRRTKRLIPYLL